MNTEMTMDYEPDQKDSIQHWNRCLEAVATTKDKATYMLFYDHFAPRLNSWLLGVTKDAELAEELVQETMLTVWRKSGQYDSSKAAASTWLFRIARNMHVDHLRRLKVRARADSMMLDVEPDEPEVHGGMHYDTARIRDAIKQLPVQQAQVIYKSYFEGKSHQEIANDMDLPLGSVKSSVRLAFQKLSKVLRP
ncbi:sigma-70 family RNA polymerase sigma factor [Neptunomonas antarctica]|uniref:RNA polymerase sigma factor n=1 Tax=Neptunomonas antarctica TaxID=619304 RepID=A0A1N7IWR0_9GAMM|nr:sigma-70 family RNA polymerase sigma factor [Neptunomonas antarctica]SIS41520.1 RNA polymerase sigma-70 factor, ECF subfamily [Neptunomonas antarctica]